jgi:energy-coupling factor transporter ATP-binding protein EcfA2
MITKLVIRNFKRIQDQSYSFTDFDLLVGWNNSGKSTILQALAIWQFCIDEFHRAKRHGKTGIQIVLPNFTALPVPEFNLLWTEKRDRVYPEKKQEYILIEIDVTWRGLDGKDKTFGVRLRYLSPQTVYAIPAGGWDVFREYDKERSLPRVAYVPPFSGLEPIEEWKDTSILRKQVGKGQPGSILRNLLLLVVKEDEQEQEKNWDKISSILQRWFSIELKKPQYEQGVDTQITCEYVDNTRNYDIIAGGSGFHQTLTLLAFLYGYRPTTILLDEPDAHLHVNLQREILDYFRKMSVDRNIQFLIATHAEELIKGVDANRVVSLLQHKPIRESSKPDILGAMADVSNVLVNQLRSSPYLVYVEGDSDERILRTWGRTLGSEADIVKLCFKDMQGGNKEEMRKDADKHFRSVKQIIPEAKRLMIFDYDTDETAFHPEEKNEVLFEWKRRNIENYLLIPDAWKKAVRQVLGSVDDLFLSPYDQIIKQFFAEQNLTLPSNKKWIDLDSNVFMVVDGKKILFDAKDSLFNKLRCHNEELSVTREAVACAMNENEIHQDIQILFKKISQMLCPS